MPKWKYLLSSRKFWAAVIGLIVMVVKVWKPDLPIEAEELAALVSVLAVYILGTAIEDGLSAFAKF
jgi:hypothetical protein